MGRPAVSYSDGHEKIHEITTGLITGSGLKELLDSVRDRLARHAITHTKEINAIIRDEIERIRDIPLMVEDLEEVLNTTGWIYTYEGQEDHRPIMRLGLNHGTISRALGDEQYLVEKGGGCVWVEGGLGNEASMHYTQYLQHLMSNDELLNDPSHAMPRMLEIFSTLVAHTSSLANSISPKYTVGIHQVGGEKKILGPIDVAPEIDAQVREYIDNLESRLNGA